MTAIWLAVIGASLTAFLNKYIGHSVPEKWLDRPRFKRINTLVPIVLLSALVGIQTFAQGSKLLIDQRVAGVAVALIALKFKAPSIPPFCCMNSMVLLLIRSNAV